MRTEFKKNLQVISAVACHLKPFTCYLLVILLGVFFMMARYEAIHHKVPASVIAQHCKKREGAFLSKSAATSFCSAHLLPAAPLDHLSEKELKEFPGARVIESAEINGPEPGEKIRMRILETKFKYPYLRTEEVVDAFSGDAVSRAEMVADHLLVTLADGADAASFLNQLGAEATSLERVTSEAPLYRLHLKTASLSALPQILNEISSKKLAALITEPDFLAHASLRPNDSLYEQQWALWKFCNGVDGYNPSQLFYSGIDAVDAWDVRTSAASIVVAVIDTGIRYTHEDLAANMWHNSTPSCGDVYGFNYSVSSNDPKCNDPMDDMGHGTHCAGIIGAVGNNGVGITGIAWNVQLMALKWLNAQGLGACSDAVSCIDYACNHGAKILNCSWGFVTPVGYQHLNSNSIAAKISDIDSTALKEAITRAQNQGVIVVAAAGNEGTDNDQVPQYPASYGLDNIVSVTATTAANELVLFSNTEGSNYGATTVHLAAPGDQITSTWADSDSSYFTAGGTSMAAPHVVGALALMMAQFPNRTYQELIARLLATTDKVPALTGKTISGGRLNLARALGAIL